MKTVVAVMISDVRGAVDFRLVTGGLRALDGVSVRRELGLRDCVPIAEAATEVERLTKIGATVTATPIVSRMMDRAAS